MKALSRVWPELRRPRKSSLSFIKLSVSSNNRVGFHFSMDRKSALDVILLADRGRRQNFLITLLRLVFPHLFSGEVIIAIGDTLTTSMNQVKADHKVAVSRTSRFATT